MKPKVLRSVSEMSDWRKTVTGPIGIVPTMGALHRGHAALLREQRKASKVSVLSIFVNPAQFGPAEDFSKYPRTFEKDLQLAEDENVDVIFYPSADEMYPAGYSTYVEETDLAQPLCGKIRPGHFRGVATIVLKLFNLVRPDTAYFGIKDAQQFFILNKMIQDLNLDLKIKGVATVREPDGLALSSRNKYLSQEERERAPLLTKTLRSLKSKVQGAQDVQGVEDVQGAPSLERVRLGLAQHQEILERNGFRVQYLDCVELPFLRALAGSIQKDLPYLISVAAYLGQTRLIDNEIVWPEKLAKFGICLLS